MKSIKVLNGFRDLNGNKFSTWSELSIEVIGNLHIYGEVRPQPADKYDYVGVDKEKIIFPFYYRNVTVFEKIFPEGEGKVIFDRKTGNVTVEAEFIDEGYNDHLVENLEIYYSEPEPDKMVLVDGIKFRENSYAWRVIKALKTYGESSGSFLTGYSGILEYRKNDFYTNAAIYAFDGVQRELRRRSLIERTKRSFYRLVEK